MAVSVVHAPPFEEHDPLADLFAGQDMSRGMHDYASDASSFLVPFEPVGTERSISDLITVTLEKVGRSHNTSRAYRTAIGLFLQFLDRETGDWLPSELSAQWRPFAVATRVASASGKRTVWRTAWEYRAPARILRLVDARLLQSFRSWLQAEGDSPNAVNARVYAVRTFLRVALCEGILSSEQSLRLGLKPYRPRQSQAEQEAGRRLTREEVRRLRAVCTADTVKGKRDRALLDMMLFAGLDAHEVADLQLVNLREEADCPTVVVNGRGRQFRSLKLHPILAASLAAWLDAAGAEPGGQGHLFRSVNKSGQVGSNGLTASVVLRLVAEYGESAGLAASGRSGRLTARDLRRTCARNAYDNGASLLLVQTMLGHSDPKTTVKYIGAFEDEEATAVDYVRY